jgi:hypothetical protein
MFGLEYNSDALGALRERIADPATGILRGVEIKYDPADISVVWVIAQDPDSPRSTIAVPAYCKQMRYARGVSEYQHMVIKAHGRAQFKKRILTVEQLMKAKQELAEIARKMIGDRNAGGGAVKLARYLNVNRAYLYDPDGLDDAEASARFLALVDDESVSEDEADAVPARRKSVVAPTVESPETAVEAEPEPVGTALLRAEASAGRRNLGVIRDE